MTEFGTVLVSLAFTQTQPEAGASPPAAPVQAAPRVPGSVGNGGTTGTQSSTQSPLPPGGPPAGPQGFGMMWMVVVFAFLLLLLPGLTGRKEKKRRAAMMAALKRNDRVQTAGGIVGTIVELRDSEVVLRVDEVTNTRITFSKSAIQGVLRESKDGGKQPGDVEPKPKPETATV